MEPQQERAEHELRYRPDIDGLRAIAVLAVVLFHAFPGRLRGGFAGVDIFFVISGYLITSIILRGVAQGRFRFSDFYIRRARRIFPALLLVLAGCAAAGWFLLLADEYRQLGKHMAGGAGFVSNVISWAESGYFDTSAETKPLLHLWSLGIEEQYYLVWPLLVLAFRSRGKLVFLIATVILLSFGVNLWKTRTDSVAAFYLPFGRFWELMVGSALAWLHQAPRLASDERSWSRIRGWLDAHASPPVSEAQAWAGLALIGAALLFTNEKAFPGWWALLAVLGAALIISAGRQAWVNRTILSHPVAVWIGLISYPLYLWHWPLLAFLRVINPEVVSRRAKLTAVALAFMLAAATYHLLEKRIRLSRKSGAQALALCGLLAATGAFGVTVYRLHGLPSRLPGVAGQMEQLAWDYVKNDACTGRFRYDKEQGWWFCVANDDAPPSVALLGNSHANHLYPGLAASPELAGRSLLNIGACDPIDKVTLRNIGAPTLDPCSEGRILDANAYVAQVLDQTPSIRFAILGSVWPTIDEQGNPFDISDPSRPAWWRLEAVDAAERALPQLEQYYRGLSRYIAAVEARHIQVILILDTPNLPYDARECLRVRPFPRTEPKDCIVPRPVEDYKQRSFRQLLPRLQADHPRLKVFDPLPFFCDRDRCPMLRGGTVLLRDKHHLSVAGSQYLASKFVAWARINVPELLKP